jgi:hypothetical protein
MLPTTLLEDLNEGLLAYTKVLIDLFQKVAVSKGSAFGRGPQSAKPFSAFLFC